MRRTLRRGTGGVSFRKGAPRSPDSLHSFRDCERTCLLIRLQVTHDPTLNTVLTMSAARTRRLMRKDATTGLSVSLAKPTATDRATDAFWGDLPAVALKHIGRGSVLLNLAHPVPRSPGWVAVEGRCSMASAPGNP